MHALDNDGSRTVRQGVVYRKTNGSYSVSIQGSLISCTLSPKLLAGSGKPDPGLPDRDRNHRAHKDFHRQKSDRKARSFDPIVVGDRVQIVAVSQGSGQITAVLPRRNKLSRRSAVPMPGAHAHEQVVAANVDRVIPVFAVADPAPKWNMLDRYLVLAESCGLPALICITKLDLLDISSETEILTAVEEYRQIGYPVILTSALTGAGIEELKAALSGRISVFLGKSGVGKTHLLNALQPGLGLRVGEVSRHTDKGQHTTTAMELYPVEFSGAGENTAVVDTPGVRELGLWEVSADDLASYFLEMRPFVGRCRFGLDCRHDEEPGCAIRKAVMSGLITPRRYQSYLRIREDGVVL